MQDHTLSPNPTSNSNLSPKPVTFKPVSPYQSPLAQKSFDLNKFAYTGTGSRIEGARSISSTSTATAVTRRSSSNTTRKATTPPPSPTQTKKSKGEKSKKRPKAAASPSLSLSDEQWSRLQSCVICEAVWTVRKSVKGKADHTKACTAKHVTTNDTVLSLIQQRLQQSEAMADFSSSKAPHTLLEDTIASNEPAQRRSRNAIRDTSEPTSRGAPRIPIGSPSRETEANLNEETNVPMEQTALTASVEHLLTASSHPPLRRLPPSNTPFKKRGPPANILSSLFGPSSTMEPGFAATQQLPPSRFSANTNILTEGMRPASLVDVASERDQPQVQTNDPLSEITTVSFLCSIEAS